MIKHLVAEVSLDGLYIRLWGAGEQRTNDDVGAWVDVNCKGIHKPISSPFNGVDRIKARREMDDDASANWFGRHVCEGA